MSNIKRQCITHATHARIIGGPDGTMKLIYHVSLLGREVLRAPVYIRKRNADRKMTAGFLRFFTRCKRKQTD